ncbi:hypothetical protein C4D60_Mb04t26900 [Musa balbisiana]|uniref:Uncharacterized protein n=1 Tax=Musa balbisiana TaxID=52838 RepID=A0A4S8KEY3_MUSBA|nr:hypothetical protein C4D60_Mb04t26900 [Musa balbisiana]
MVMNSCATGLQDKKTPPNSPCLQHEAIWIRGGQHQCTTIYLSSLCAYPKERRGEERRRWKDTVGCCCYATPTNLRS